MENQKLDFKFASEEESKSFCEKMSDKDLMPIIYSVNIKVIEFINMKEFKETQLKADDYNKKKTEYIESHSQVNKLQQIAKDTSSRFAELGLYTKQIGIDAKSLGLHDLVGDLLSFLKSSDSTPPPSSNNCHSETGK